MSASSTAVERRPNALKRSLRRLPFFIVLVGLAASGSNCASAENWGSVRGNGDGDRRPSVAIQPYGKIDPVSVEALTQAIESTYSVSLTVLPPRQHPSAAFYKPRNRYRAALLLEDLDGSTDPRYTKVIGITRSDISVTKGDVYDWGIFGLGSIGDRACVVSTYRLGHGQASPTLLNERLKKIAVHELGHTFGLYHSPIDGCVMADAEGTIATVDKESPALCALCRTLVHGAVELKDP